MTPIFERINFGALSVGILLSLLIGEATVKLFGLFPTMFYYVHLLHHDIFSRRQCIYYYITTEKDSYS